MSLGDVENISKEEINIDLPQEDTILLKERGLYCFLLRCKKDEAELPLEWAVETVLPREVRKLTSAIDEKDSALVLINNDLQERENQMPGIQYENVTG